jgi:hypothetical protein
MGILPMSITGVPPVQAGPKPAPAQSLPSTRSGAGEAISNRAGEIASLRSQ